MTYYTHDNGGRPFKVVVVKENVKIYKRTRIHVNEYDDTPIFEYQPEKIFIGKSLENKMTKYSGGCRPDFDGNSILLKMSELEYIYIGEIIKSFTSSAEITTYVSSVGNSDVVYPYAVDVDENYYLIIHDVVVSGVPRELENDPYNYYWKARLITLDISRHIPVQPIHQNFYNIDEFYIGDIQCVLNYAPYPSSYYDRTTTYYNSLLYIVPVDGEKYELSKEEYINLVEGFGELMGASPLQNINIIHERL